MLGAEQIRIVVEGKMGNRRTFLHGLACFSAGMTVRSIVPMPARAAGLLADVAPDPRALHIAPLLGNYELGVRDYYGKMRQFDTPFEGDIVLEGEQREIMLQSFARLERLAAIAGYAKFSLMGFDDAIRIASHYPKVGAFTYDELEYLECQFYSDAAVYGFFGVKALTRLTDRIRTDAVVKVPLTGNYVFRGEPYETWLAIHGALGDEVVLTSGVRGVMKQFYLFMNKAVQHNGNLSLASRSLAPPGYSFHGVGDFDVGQRGFGEANFTERFTETDVFHRLEDLGYLTLRYPRGNRLGVRFEPWHVKVKQA